ncbi:GAP family protein [Protaetiibacter intestinalis]|uniref:GAP family protein n=1 Tax=Protaetiibacter intestinalis TaxID=2419774 RepID=A0A387B0T3_9MICO|nr:GAP family protein [Protaetiibacter intestinalis]AYF97102.1 hypothetical protein D7I47_01770 [Protaetiibacter intestinalis]
MEMFVVLLPLALGVALSSVPIVAMIAILLSPRGAASGFGYLFGYAAGLAAITIGFTLGIRAIPRGDEVSPFWIGLGEIVVGAACVVVAVVIFVRERRKRGASDEPPEPPTWLRKVGELGPFSTAALGLALNLRPKALVFATGAALALNTGGLTAWWWAVDTAVYLTIGLSTVAAPIIVVWRLGDRARPALERAREWIDRNSYLVTSIALLMVGFVLIGDGLGRL